MAVASEEEVRGLGERPRLQKYLARSGVASRRASEDLIREGRVRVDGDVVTELGVRVDPRRSVVEVDGREVEPRAARWIALHKPPRFLCARSDPEGRPTVYELLPEGPIRELFHVGRLDFMSEGLLLMTNEGDLAHALLHPSSEVERRYEVVVDAPLERDLPRRLLEGVELEDGPAAPEAVVALPGPGEGEATLLITLLEGRKREIRRMLGALGVRIRSLKRVAFGPVRLGPDLEPGGWRELSEAEVEELRAAADGG